MNWIINNSIVFRPGSKCLTSLNDPDKKIILTSPASHFLLILLEAAPNIVSHQELFKKVWEDNGLIVPVNTLYHNISTIRRGLRDAGMPDNFIMTVSRKGFQIAENADLQRVDASELAAFGAPIKTPSPPSSEDVIDRRDVIYNINENKDTYRFHSVKIQKFDNITPEPVTDAKLASALPDFYVYPDRDISYTITNQGEDGFMFVIGKRPLFFCSR